MMTIVYCNNLGSINTIMVEVEIFPQHLFAAKGSMLLLARLPVYSAVYIICGVNL